MMQLRILCFLLVLVGSGVHSQQATLVGPQFDYTFTGETYYPAAGINIEGMFTRRLSFNYSVLYGPISSDQYYFYCGGGQALGVYLIDKAVEERSGLALAITLGIFSFVIPESVAYRVPLSNKSQLGIYVAPFGYEAIKNTVLDAAVERTSYEMGLRYYLAAGNWLYIVPRIGMKGFYGERALGASYGIALMFKADKN